MNSEINNHAAIFFDFNEPIITNIVSHTIGKKFLNIYRPQRPVKPIVDETTSLSVVSIFPNPAIDKVYFSTPETMRQPASLLIFNSKMQQMVRRKVEDKLIGINTRKWERGLYFWILDDGEYRWDGRLIIDK